MGLTGQVSISNCLCITKIAGIGPIHENSACLKVPQKGHSALLGSVSRRIPSNVAKELTVWILPVFRELFVYSKQPKLSQAFLIAFEI